MPDPLILEDLDDQPDKVLPAMQQLNTIGFCLLQSRVTGAIAAVVQDEIDKSRVPSGLLAYSFEDLQLLAEGVKAGTVRTIADQRLLHESKKQLGEVIVE